MSASFPKVIVQEIVIKVAIAIVKEIKMEVQPKDTSKGHFYVSLGKSAIRIAAGIALLYGEVAYAGFLLIAAEMLGVVEELV